MKIALVQMNPVIGDFDANAQYIIEASHKAVAMLDANIIVFPELVITGYPPEDLLLREDFINKSNAACVQIAQSAPPNTCLIFGIPKGNDDNNLYNMAMVIVDQQIHCFYAKQALPNYSVFDERRYFNAGKYPLSFIYDDKKIALAICEDLWDTNTAESIIQTQSDVIISLNASPFEQKKPQQRRQMLKQRALSANCPIIYVNLVGGQDELVFDGGSCVICPEDKQDLLPLSFTEGIFACELIDPPAPNTEQTPHSIAPLLWTDCNQEPLNLLYKALCIGLRDYVTKNHFKGVIIGLSGGIDSALTLAIAHDALGPGSVMTVMMPSQFTASMSLDDAATQAQELKVSHEIIPIDASVKALSKSLPGELGTQGIVQENLQARVRSNILMALSNARGVMLLSTSNKSELAVGYSTLYGDLSGGFCALKDVYKTQVYALARYRNTRSRVIPERVIERAPSAELRADQKDDDTLPPYDQLDAILKAHIEQGLSAQTIIDQGHNSDIVHDVLAMLYRSEYKRRQGPPGTKVSSKAFGRDRRFPMTSAFCGR